jgi:acylphosphatase
MKKICINAIVSGKVQGVFYRHNTRQKAQSLNITGWVKNNEDGTVELNACGTEENIKNLIDWLQEGPTKATVENVNWREIPEETHTNFKIIRDN